MKQSQMHTLFVTCPKGLQYALEKELCQLGVESPKPTPSGVSCTADARVVYNTLLWSRIANRVVLQLTAQKVSSADELYELASSVDWGEHFSVEDTFAVDFFCSSSWVKNSTICAHRIKDAIVDQFRQKTGIRPSISKDKPAIRISAHLSKGAVTIGIDLSGDSLHKRGYRSATGRAPMKENLAAGILILSGWPKSFESGASFVDPMCGSGTLLIEAAQMLCDKAPGLEREYWGFSAWKQHDQRLWSALCEEARSRYAQGLDGLSTRIVGFDSDSRVVSRAWENIREAGFEDLIHVEKRALDDFTLFEKMHAGLVLTNPPYGERLGEIEELSTLYRDLGRCFEQQLQGWRAGVFTGNADLGKKLGWRSYKQYQLFNGAIESQLILVELQPENRFKSEWRSPDEQIRDPSYWQVAHEERAQMLRNRLLKNLKNMGKWAKKSGVSCYRLYDADMPEFALAIDIYGDEHAQNWLHIQEYAAPKSVDEKASMERLREALYVIRDCLGVPEERMFLKRREVQKGRAQYEKASAEESATFCIYENGIRLKVNLSDYLDTGLFLDHRPIRRWMKAQAKGKRVLNLFSYTGAVTLSAAMGGAKSTTSVDMSRTYLNWAKDNLCENKLDVSKHELIQSDCVEWLKSVETTMPYDIIFLDPPSFSNSKRMQGVLDIQRDHVSLLMEGRRLLAEDGVLVFSNNLRKFKLDPALDASFEIENISPKTIDKDFERNTKIHHCWLLKRR